MTKDTEMSPFDQHRTSIADAAKAAGAANPHAVAARASDHLTWNADGTPANLPAAIAKVKASAPNMFRVSEAQAHAEMNQQIRQLTGRGAQAAAAEKGTSNG